MTKRKYVDIPYAFFDSGLWADLSDWAIALYPVLLSMLPEGAKSARIHLNLADVARLCGKDVDISIALMELEDRGLLSCGRYSDVTGEAEIDLKDPMSMSFEGVEGKS